MKKRGPVPTTEYSHKYYGATYLLDSVSQKIGLTHDLKLCFPGSYKQILSLAFYLLLEPDNTLYRFEKWNHTHWHPYGKNISSTRSSDIFSNITDAQRTQFFQLQGRRRTKEEYLAYDTTSISSYSEALHQVQYGKNKEDDRLPQLNLALVFGEESNLPFYYRKLPGNVPDTKTLLTLLEDFESLGFDKAKFVMDRGFYSEANINSLYKERVKFLMSAKTSTTFIKKHIDSAADSLVCFENYIPHYEIYGTTITAEWDYTQERPRKGDKLKEKRRIYVHVYYDKKRAVEEEVKLDAHLSRLKYELENEERQASNSKDYLKYFEIKSTPKRGAKVTLKSEVVALERKYAGYFVLVSNEKKNTAAVLELYRNKDAVEKAFGNLKDKLGMRRLLVSSELSLEGKIFVQFISLILHSYLKKQMALKNIYSRYSFQEAMDKLDVIECFLRPGKSLAVGEVLKAQSQSFTDFGITSL